MTDGGATRYYWCLRHNRVETDDDKCPERFLLGPFGTADEASHALEKVRERNEEWDAEDARWHGDTP
jgi:hypothetical protein